MKWCHNIFVQTKLITIKIQTVKIVSKSQNRMIVIKSKHFSHQTFRWRQIINQRTLLSCATIEISCKIDKYFVFNDDESRKMFVITIHDLRMAKAASDISIIVKNLNRCERHKMIYRTINVTEQNDFRFERNFLKNKVSKLARDNDVWWKMLNIIVQSSFLFSFSSYSLFDMLEYKFIANEFFYVIMYDLICVIFHVFSDLDENFMNKFYVPKFNKRINWIC